MFGTSSYEDSLLDMIILPNQIEVQFNDIGGLDAVKSDLMETVLVPLMHPDLTNTSRLCAPPLGVLFYGVPGTGKSMMAKAVARETNATFFSLFVFFSFPFSLKPLNVDMSRLMSKWYGDSQKYISALFSLAKKMAPSIIWIDEIDALFSQRSRSDHQADMYNKALFLSLWDGLASSSSDNCEDDFSSYQPDDSDYSYDTNYYGNTRSSKRENQKSQVIILGATNRPEEVDEAFLRRMGRQYEFDMPDKKTRKLILYILLQYEQYDTTVDLEKLAETTDGYSGSDLKELCKYAATLPLREYVRNSNVEKQAHKTNAEEKDDIKKTSDDNDSKNEESTFWKSLYTITPGIFSSKQSKNTDKDNPRNKERVIDSYSQHIRNNNVKLRPITMTDFEHALKQVKSTTKTHQQHENRFADPLASSSLMHMLANLNLSEPNSNLPKKVLNSFPKKKVLKKRL
ncbi:hypothetical protein RFI_24881 [Reticulomyxa filosa]|uniref:AAA+ ATPase domain-containing protein n=1 Tax=Reticulomyxa filosa TaxID=46433 RepID=X6MGG1_RETFI|nr:hypothetical protein RFI_24881 [Reticulomyxa filosa]|eukprot:ETO12497.1 hypothetical protein RFI_24881 [Reticulomyxa filosa]